VDLVKRALGLLSLWGECVYFESPPELSAIVILDPRFLTKGILADLFSSNPTVQSMKKDGVVRHVDLNHIWKRFHRDGMSAEDFNSLCSTFITLLQTLGVCFAMEEDRSKPFMERRSIIPALLLTRRITNSQDKSKGNFGSDDRKHLFDTLWPQDPPFDRPVEIERSLLFNVIPAELVSRLLVRLYDLIQDSLVWRDEVLLFQEKNNTQAWIRISISDNSFCVSLRGSSEKACLEMMDFITSEVNIGSKSYSGVTFSEAIRSPFSINTLIFLSEAMTAMKEKRRLKCPETHFPLNPVALLQLGGYAEGQRLNSELFSFFGCCW